MSANNVCPICNEPVIYKTVMHPIVGVPIETNVYIDRDGNACHPACKGVNLDLTVCEDCGTEYNHVDYWSCPTCRPLTVYYAVTCAACGQHMSEDEEAHWGHEPGCLALTNPADYEGCECDIYYHPACCPDCECYEDSGEDWNFADAVTWY